MMSRAAQTLLASHMRPAGRVFETPALEYGDGWVVREGHFTILGVHLIFLSRANQRRSEIHSDDSIMECC